MGWLPAVASVLGEAIGAGTAGGVVGTAANVVGAGKALGSIGNAVGGAVADTAAAAGKNMILGVDGAKALDNATKFLPKTSGAGAAKAAVPAALGAADFGDIGTAGPAAAAGGEKGVFGSIADRAVSDAGDWWDGVKATNATGWQMPGIPAPGEGMELPGIEDGGGWEAVPGVLPKDTPVEATDWGKTGANLGYEAAKAAFARSMAGGGKKSAAAGTIPDVPLPEVPDNQTYAPNAEDELNKLRARMNA